MSRKGFHHGMGCIRCHKEGGQIPDVIYDKGGVGKEAMIRVIGVMLSGLQQGFANSREDDNNMISLNVDKILGW